MTNSGDFCSNYQPHPDVESWIASEKDDFYHRYYIWRKAGSKEDQDVMFYFFGKVFDKVVDALDKGKGAPQGGVAAADCSKFHNFRDGGISVFLPEIGPREKEILAANGIAVPIASSPALDKFKVLLLLYFAGIELPEKVLRSINGTIFVQVDLKGIAAGGSQHDKRLFVIPGDHLIDYDTNLGLGIWDIVDKQISAALDAVRSNTINVTGAVQLRLGDKDLAIYEPIKVGGGMTIMGRA